MLFLSSKKGLWKGRNVKSHLEKNWFKKKNRLVTFRAACKPANCTRVKVWWSALQNFESQSHILSNLSPLSTFFLWSLHEKPLISHLTETVRPERQLSNQNTLYNKTSKRYNYSNSYFLVKRFWTNEGN